MGALAPRPLWQVDGSGESDPAQLVAPTGEHFLPLPAGLAASPSPPKPEPLGPRLKVVLPSGEKEHSAHAAAAAAHRAADEARRAAGPGEVVY